ncbi:MAG: hypothetical protein H0T89_14475 [Deltaproteobacteria bacterium]|nr:hypothetical protein [Deltaproteobacteria bacterium]MDQ3296197.1 hypothetical protein [Myxococcota bacterium]
MKSSVAIMHVARRELAARWILVPASIVVGVLALLAIHSIDHVRGDADGILAGTWVATLGVSVIVGMSLLGEELTNSRLSFYFARPFSPSTIFGGKVAAGVLLALFMQLAIVVLVGLALPALSWQGSVLAERGILILAGERILATVACTMLGMAASVVLGAKTRWFVVDAVCLAIVGVIATWVALNVGVGEVAPQVGAFGIAVLALGLATARALSHGRTDRMRAHATLSSTLWPITVPAAALLLILAR